MMSEGIFHIAKADDWAAAKESGRYEWSTRDARLADVGYIHCSFATQVAMVANLVYTDAPEPLVLLRINPAAVTATIQIESLDGGNERFPHIYGPLEVGWVTDVFAFDRNPAGRFELPSLPSHHHATDNIAKSS
ncbi:MAG TPA: DUF952 domain-containing protein [Mycobacteriales bacterium]|jgi:uncharacterized protein (DUF952 family)|nr:DUF952 domain-containing protein [Mycobacteriales bacterium]